jgi:hypothetical protein
MKKTHCAKLEKCIRVVQNATCGIYRTQQYTWHYCSYKLCCLLDNVISLSSKIFPLFAAGSKNKGALSMLSITTRQSLLYVTFSAALFLHLQQVSNTARINHNYFIHIRLLHIRTQFGPFVPVHATGQQSRC